MQELTLMSDDIGQVGIRLLDKLQRHFLGFALIISLILSACVSNWVLHGGGGKPLEQVCNSLIMVWDHIVDIVNLGGIHEHQVIELRGQTLALKVDFSKSGYFAGQGS